MLAREASTFPGGAVAVDLAPVRQPALVVPRIAAALGLPEVADDDPLDALVRHLRGLRVLLVLDNLEQLTGAAPVLADLVARCPDLVVLATSRAPLRVRAEHEVVLSPLATPTDDDVETVAGSPAVALLLDRGRGRRLPHCSHRRRRRHTGRHHPPVRRPPSCARARRPRPAAALPHHPARATDADRIGCGLRDLPERHRTMTAVLDWSMDLLEPEEVDLFERLAVFSGGFSLDSVEAVPADDEGVDVLPALGTLVDQSLVLRVPSRRPATLSAARAGAAVRDAAAPRVGAGHGDRGQARRALPRERDGVPRPAEGAGSPTALDRLEADHANLRSAFLRLLELDRDGDAAELAGGLWLYLARCVVMPARGWRGWSGSGRGRPTSRGAGP